MHPTGGLHDLAAACAPPRGGNLRLPSNPVRACDPRRSGERARLRLASDRASARVCACSPQVHTAAFGPADGPSAIGALHVTCGAAVNAEGEERARLCPRQRGLADAYPAPAARTGTTTHGSVATPRGTSSILVATPPVQHHAGRPQGRAAHGGECLTVGGSQPQLVSILAHG